MTFRLTPAIRHDFVNRENLLEQVLGFLRDPKSKDGISLYGLRRMGKTSLMLKLVEELQKSRDVVPVYLSLWELNVRQPDIFSNELIAGILQAYAPLSNITSKIKEVIKESKKWFLELLKSFKLSVETTEEITAIFSLNPAQEKIDSKNIVLIPFKLAEDLAKKHKTKTVLFIDEFPDLMDFEHSGKKLGIQIIKNIRTFLERAEHVSFSIAGSIRSTMDLVAVDDASPFYRQFVNREVKPFGDNAVYELLNKNLKEAGWKPEKLKKEYLKQLTDWMMNNTHGIPFYIQCFGRMLTYTQFDPLSKEGEKEIWNLFLENEAPIIYRSDIKELNNSERRLLEVMSPYKEFNFALAKKMLGPTISNTGQWLTSLTNKSILLNPERGLYRFVDTIFQKYLYYLQSKQPLE